MSVFEKYRANAYPYRYEGSLHVFRIAGGTPSDPNVAEGWLKSKLGADKDALIQEMVAKIMVERGATADEAVETANTMKNLNGFKRLRCGKCPEKFTCDGTHQLYIEGRQLKSAIKEATSCAVAAGKLKKQGWGKTNKGILGYLAEHVFVVEDTLPLGVTEPSGIAQRFISTYRGTGIQYEEYVDDAKVDFTVMADHDFTEKEWATIWLTGEQQGIGSSRSQGYGRYEVVRWERVT